MKKTLARLREREGAHRAAVGRIGRDRDEALDLLLWDLQDDSEIGELVNDIVDDMLARFDLIEAGELRRRGDGWAAVRAQHAGPI